MVDLGKFLLMTTCPCGNGEIESVKHVIFHCRMYDDCKNKLISPLIGVSLPGSPTALLLSHLEVVSTYLTGRVSKFLMIAMRTREKMLQTP